MRRREGNEYMHRCIRTNILTKNAPEKTVKLHCLSILYCDTSIFVSFVKALFKTSFDDVGDRRSSTFVCEAGEAREPGGRSTG